MRAAQRLPAHMLEQVRDFDAGRRTPSEPRAASTVVLLRSGSAARPGALEVYLQRRHVGMAFAAGMRVFPGGAVDPRDFDHDVGWAGPPPSEWAARLGTDEEHARALVCAAVRETFEESGVLFAGPEADRVVEDTTGPDWEDDRRRLETRELPFTDFLRHRELMVRADLLRAWGSWLTPVFEPRRYRAWFFVAELPAGQRTRQASTESDEASWMSVRDAIAAVDAEEMLMLPPTYYTCLELYDCRTPAEALAAAGQRDLVPVEPGVQYDGDAAYVTIPDHLVELGELVGRRMSA